MDIYCLVLQHGLDCDYNPKEHLEIKICSSMRQCHVYQRPICKEFRISLPAHCYELVQDVPVPFTLQIFK